MIHGQLYCPRASLSLRRAEFIPLFTERIEIRSTTKLSAGSIARIPVRRLRRVRAPSDAPDGVTGRERGETVEKGKQMQDEGHIAKQTRHIIRLRGPWEYRPLTRTVRLPDGSLRETTAALPPPGRLRIPADWGRILGADFRGRVLLTRRFGQPTGLALGDRVDLVFELVETCGAATLNGTLLGPMLSGQGCPRFDITARLQRRNELNLVVELPLDSPHSPPRTRLGREGLPGGLLGEVRLEILAAS